MVVYQWIERLFGQTVAPDDKYDLKVAETQVPSIFDTLAPPIYQQEGVRVGKSPNNKGPPSSAFKTPRSQDISSVSFLATPTSRSKLSTPLLRSGAEPSSAHRTPTRIALQSPELKLGILDACNETLEWEVPEAKFLNPKLKHFVTRFTQKEIWNDKVRLQLQECLDQDPWLVDYRTGENIEITGGVKLPAGYTPLMICALMNHVEAARLFLNQSSAADQLIKVSREGDRAMHIAASKGNMEVLELLRAASIKLLGEQDTLLHENSLGHTPLGAGLVRSRIQPRSAAFQQLLSPEDPCIYGRSLAHSERSGQDRALQLVAGYYAIPGVRITMEDAHLMSLGPSPAIFGVFDGHDDAANCSLFCCDQVEKIVPQLYSQNNPPTLEEWTSAWLNIDAELKSTGFEGGTTAVVASVTTDTIVVTNLGDSRCILVQLLDVSSTSDADPVVDDMAKDFTEKLSVESPTVAADTTIKTKDDAPRKVNVIPLSYDHKPELPIEMARIDQISNFEITEIPTKDSSGADMVLHRIIKRVRGTVKSSLAVARTFGDFEFKSKKDVSPQDQAVIAVPDVIEHKRTTNDAFLILACDGVWDVMSNEEVGQFVADQVHSCLGQEKSDYIMATVADRLVHECFSRYSNDNLSVVLVALSGMADRLSAVSLCSNDQEDVTNALHFSPKTPSSALRT